MVARDEPEWDPFADPALLAHSDQADCIPPCIAPPNILEPSTATVYVRVNSLTGEFCNISADCSLSVADLKAEIQCHTGVPAREQGLVADASLLSDEALLHELPLQALTNLTLVRSNDPVLTSLTADGLQLRLAPDYCREDASYVTAAVRQNGLALEYATARLRADRQTVIAAVKQNGLALQHASEDLKADRELVLRAVKQHGHALQHASGIFQEDLRIVRAAVARSGTALQFAAERLWADVDTVLIAVKQNPQAAFMAPRALWENPEFWKVIDMDDSFRRILQVAIKVS